MNRTIDVTNPFVAIRRDVDGGYFTRTMGEYFCNPGPEPIADVRVELSGFFSTDDAGVVESVPHAKPAFDVPAGAAVRFGLSTQAEYDDLVVGWFVRYRTAAGARVETAFGTSKRLADAAPFDDRPGLGGPGLVVPRTVA